MYRQYGGDGLGIAGTMGLCCVISSRSSSGCSRGLRLMSIKHYIRDAAVLQMVDSGTSDPWGCWGILGLLWGYHGDIVGIVGISWGSLACEALTPSAAADYSFEVQIERESCVMSRTLVVQCQ